MNFEPITDELLKNGKYKYFIKNSLEHISSESGKESIKLTAEIFDSVKKLKLLTIYLYGYKLKNFCEVHDMEEQYSTGVITAHSLIGRTGDCLVGIEKGGEKPKGGKYNDKNNIIKFLKNNEVELDEDVLF